MSETEEEKSTWIQFMGKASHKVAVTVDDESVSICVAKENGEDHVRLSNETFAAILAIFTQLRGGITPDECIKWLQENPAYRVNTFIETKPAS